VLVHAFHRYISVRNPAGVVPLALVMMIVVALAYYVTGYGLQLAILYLLPIAAATWAAGRRVGVMFSALAAALWITTDLLSGHRYANPLYFHWEWIVRLTTYLIFVIVLDHLKHALGEADEALQTSEGRYQALVAALPYGVLEADLAGRILVANPALGRMLRTPDSRLRERSVHELFEDPANAGEHMRAVLDRAASRGPYLGRLKRGDGGRIDARVDWVCKRDRRGEPAGYIAVVTDVTEQKLAEETSRKQQERLQLVSRLITVGEMASTLAHELNQPLASIVNFNMGCVRRIRSGSWNAPELLGALEQASAQAERAGHIIQRIRDMVTKREPSRAVVDVNDIIGEAAHLVEIDAGKKGVRVLLDLAEGLPPVRADRVMIEQVILNLVKNAIEAMEQTEPARRELTMRSSLDGGHAVEIALADRGIGVPEELYDGQFPPFFTTKRDGMGLGLSICRSIVELHDGRLWASRNPGGGSIFRFTLPMVST
jgi:two-component system, LuxR family, sensor histidine kinase DctS